MSYNDRERDASRILMTYVAQVNKKKCSLLDMWPAEVNVQSLG